MTERPARTWTPPTAREVAATALLRIEKDDAYASAALDAELGRAAQLDGRNRALATELTYGVLRVRPWIDAKLTALLRRGTLEDVAPHLRNHLRVAVYQLYFLDRVPAFAAVNEAVDRVRAVGGAKGAAFANALLRKIAHEAALLNNAPNAGDPGNDARSRLARAALDSAPAWLRAKLVASVGEAHATSLLTGVADKVPAIGLRVENAEMRAAWIAKIAAAAPDAEVTNGQVSPLAILLRGAGDPHKLPGYAEGAWAVQEEGSQLVALAAGARAGETVLDACAGRGGKSALLARAVGPTGSVDVCDVHPFKLNQLRRELARVGLAPRNAFAVDWAAGSGEVGEMYDAVLIDAPCSGSGTLRRRPDVLLRRSEASLRELAALQTAIAVRAASHVRVGGRLVYAVCSVLEDEGEAVVRAILAADPGLCLAPFAGDAVRALTSATSAENEATLRLLPDVHGTDGYFLASFVRDRPATLTQ